MSTAKVSLLQKVKSKYEALIHEEVSQMPQKPRIVGLLSTQAQPALTYASYMQKAFNAFGIPFELRNVPQEALPQTLQAANNDPEVHGLFVFYPIFNDQRDKDLRDGISPYKDVEGLSAYWRNKLYVNERFVVAQEEQKKAVLPCTSLAIVKMLEEHFDWQGSQPLQGRTISVFNRSEVVGRPLAGMLSNDGARVYSFDIDSVQLFEGGAASPVSVDRAEALAQSSIVITGVPTDAFDKIKRSEIRPDTFCLNFSFVKNFEADVPDYVTHFIPRVGPVTVLMCVRNSLRLYQNFHS